MKNEWMSKWLAQREKEWMGEQLDMDQSEIKEKNEWMIELIAQSKNKETE
jgi:hypothetical protein